MGEGQRWRSISEFASGVGLVLAGKQDDSGGRGGQSLLLLPIDAKVLTESGVEEEEEKEEEGGMRGVKAMANTSLRYLLVAASTHLSKGPLDKHRQTHSAGVSEYSAQADSKKNPTRLRRNLTWLLYRHPARTRGEIRLRGCCQQHMRALQMKTAGVKTRKSCY